MTQNAQKLNWTAEEVDAKAHPDHVVDPPPCLEYGTEKDGYINYMKGANIAGFMKVAKSMVEQGSCNPAGRTEKKELVSTDEKSPLPETLAGPKS